MRELQPRAQRQEESVAGLGQETPSLLQELRASGRESTLRVSRRLSQAESAALKRAAPGRPKQRGQSPSAAAPGGMGSETVASLLSEDAVPDP